MVEGGGKAEGGVFIGGKRTASSVDLIVDLIVEPGGSLREQVVAEEAVLMSYWSAGEGGGRVDEGAVGKAML